MNTQQNINQMMSLAGLLYTQSSFGKERHDKRANLIRLQREQDISERKHYAKTLQAGSEAEVAEAKVSHSEEEARIAEERYLYTGKGKKDLVKAEERLELDRNLAYNLRHQEELDKMGMEYDIQHNIEHIPSPAQARAEKNRQAADAAEVERINKSNEAIEQLKPYEEMIRRAGTYYTGGERLDK